MLTSRLSRSVRWLGLGPVTTRTRPSWRRRTPPASRLATCIWTCDIKIEMQEDRTLPVKVAAYHLHFLLADYVKLRDWYVDTFSLVPRKRGTIVTTADAPGMTKGRTIDHIGFETTNLQAFCKKLEARGVKFDVPFRNIPAIGLNIAYITDPSGVYSELIEGYNKY